MSANNSYAYHLNEEELPPTVPVETQSPSASYPPVPPQYTTQSQLVPESEVNYSEELPSTVPVETQSQSAASAPVRAQIAQRQTVPEPEIDEATKRVKEKEE